MLGLQATRGITGKLSRRGWARGLAGAGAVAAAVLLGGCQTNPTTGRSQAIAFTWQEEVEIGQQEAPKMLAEFGGEVARQELRDYVQEVGMRLAATTGQDDPVLAQIPWRFYLLDSDVINAFALPGGQVFMSRGLAARMTNEAQLAGVLGHEIGHVAARHANERIARATYTQAGVGIFAGILGGPEYGQVLADLGNMGAGFWLLSYSRDQELESDVLGMRYMTRVGYDPRGMRQVMEILMNASEGGQPAEFFSTHPAPQTRIQRIDEALATEYASTQNNPQFQLREQEFRNRFLRNLAVAFPPGRPEDPAVTAFARSRGLCGEECRH